MTSVTKVIEIMNEVAPNCSAVELKRLNELRDAAKALPPGFEFGQTTYEENKILRAFWREFDHRLKRLPPAGSQ
jgi:hypothetical protein